MAAFDIMLMNVSIYIELLDIESKYILKWTCSIYKIDILYGRISLNKSLLWKSALIWHESNSLSFISQQENTGLVCFKSFDSVVRKSILIFIKINPGNINIAYCCLTKKWVCFDRALMETFIMFIVNTRRNKNSYVEASKQTSFTVDTREDRLFKFCG